MVVATCEANAAEAVCAVSDGGRVEHLVRIQLIRAVYGAADASAEICVGGYESKYGDLCDIGNWGRAALLHPYAVCIPEPLVQYTNHQGSTTSQSAVQQWQQWAQTVHADLLASARAANNAKAERQLRAAKRNFISGITLTILIQTIGKPGWIRNALREALRSPGAFFTPYMFRRFLKDGRKVLTVRRHAKLHPQAPASLASSDASPVEKVS